MTAVAQHRNFRPLLHLAGQQRQDGLTALMCAAGAGNEEAVLALVDQEAMMTSDKKYTALMLAAHQGKQNCIELLLREKGMQSQEGRTALMIALLENHSDCVELLYDEVGYQDNEGNTALMCAAQVGNDDAVQHLKRFEMKNKNNNGRTALMLASMTGKYQCIQLLLDEMHLQDVYGQNALMLAIITHHQECAELLYNEAGYQDKEGFTAMMCAAQEGNSQSIIQLKNVEQRKQNTEGLTALMGAAKYGYQNCVKLLLFEQGIKDKYGQTALIHSIMNKHQDCANLLYQEAGISDVPDIMCAAEFGLKYAVKDLSKCYCVKKVRKSNLCQNLQFQRYQIIKIQQQNSFIGKNKETANLNQAIYMYNNIMQKETALMKAICSNNIDCIKYLLYQAGCQNEQGFTAMMVAAKQGYADVIKHLRNNECKMQNHQGISALMVAARKGSKSCVKELLCETGLQDKFGRTAWIFAITNNKINCVELLLCEQQIVDNNFSSVLMYAAKNVNLSYRMQYQIVCVLNIHKILQLQQQVKQSSITIIMLCVTNTKNQFITQGQIQKRHVLSKKMSMIFSLLKVPSYQHNNLYQLKDKQGRTALMHSITSNNYFLTQQLLKQEQHLKDNFGHSIIFYASYSGNFNLLEQLHANAQQIVFELNKNNITKLMLAVRFESKNHVIMNMCKTSRHDFFGQTALNHVINSGSEEMIMTLQQFYHENIANSVIKNVIKDNRSYLLEYCFQSIQQLKLMEKLMQYAIEHQRISCVRQLLFYDYKWDIQQYYYDAKMYQNTEITSLFKQRELKSQKCNISQQQMQLMYIFAHYQHEIINKIIDIKISQSKVFDYERRVEQLFEHQQIFFHSINIQNQRDNLQDCIIQNWQFYVKEAIKYLKFHDPLLQNIQYQDQYDVCFNIQDIFFAFCIISKVQNRPVALNLTKIIQGDSQKMNCQEDCQNMNCQSILKATDTNKCQNVIIPPRYIQFQEIISIARNKHSILSYYQHGTKTFEDGETISIQDMYSQSIQEDKAKTLIMRLKDNNQILRVAKITKVQQQSQNEWGYRNEFLFEIHHKNIINIVEGNILESQDGSNFIYMIMEEGIPIHEYFKNEITIDNIYDIVLDVIDGLLYLHSQMIVHRDIKPDNILIVKTEKSWKAVIIDFNIATRLGYAKSMQYCGTNGFMAPEVVVNSVQCSEYSYKVDNYSLGRLIEKLLEKRDMQSTSQNNLKRTNLFKKPYDISSQIKDKRLRRVSELLCREKVSQRISLEEARRQLLKPENTLGAEMLFEEVMALM